MLIAALKRFAEQREIPLKTCLLIDGLDEFAGDHEEILSLFKEIAHSENVKICLSSRPWPIFREPFKLCPTLRLQDLTFPDIDKFVREKLQQNELFNKIKAEEPKDAEALMEEIVSKANGVFLWVRIVIRSLSEGMVNRDSIHELLARLRELPTEIELLYEHLLGLIKSVYLQWTCKVVQIVQLVYRLSECHPSPSIGLRGLYFAINDNIDFDKVLKLSPDSLARKCEDTEIHLAARGAGLLEVGYSQYHDRGSIGWFHRTARDFVEQNWDKLNIVTKTSNAAFSPNMAMMKSNILELMCEVTFHPKTAKEPIFTLAMTCAIFASDADGVTETHQTQHDLLDRMDSFLATHWSEEWTNIFLLCWGLEKGLGPSFLYFAARCNLTSYVTAKLSNATPEHIKSITKALLDFKSEPSASRDNGKGHDDVDESLSETRDAHMIALLRRLAAGSQPKSQSKVTQSRKRKRKT